MATAIWGILFFGRPDWKLTFAAQVRIMPR